MFLQKKSRWCQFLQKRSFINFYKFFKSCISAAYLFFTSFKGKVKLVFSQKATTFYFSFKTQQKNFLQFCFIFYLGKIVFYVQSLK